MKITFDITGMTCSACQARVEKAASGVEGVEKAVVNLLKNTLDVQCSGSPETTALIVAAIEKAGYGAYPRGAVGAGAGGVSGGEGTSSAAGSNIAGTQAARAKTNNAAEKEAAHVKFRLIVSFCFTIPLFYLSMGHMFGWPLPACFLGNENLMVFAFTQFLLLLPVIFVNFKFFRVGFKTLVHGAPTMDTLIALGSTASTLYGIAAVYRMAAAFGAGDITAAHHASMDLYFESAAMILTLITLGKFFEARAKGKTTNAITSLMDLAPKTAIRVSPEGSETEIPIENVQVGDTLLVKAGQAVPVDGVVLTGSGTVDESALTGESIPVEKTPGSALTGATLNQSGWFTMKAERVGADTTLANIVRLVDEATSTKAPIEKLADKISGIFVPVVIGLALITFIVWMVITQEVGTALVYAVSVLVISCPCALGLATPTAIMVGTGRGATYGILIKSADALERAHALKTVVFDKTGTITQGTPQVSDVVWVSYDFGCADDRAGLDCASDGVARAGSVYCARVEQGAVKNVVDSHLDENYHFLLSLALSLEEKSSHPLACAVAQFVRKQNIDAQTISNFEEIAGKGLKASLDGNVVCVGNARFMEENNVSIAPLKERAQAYTDEGKTPLFFACGEKALGFMALADEVKPTSAYAIKALRGAGISTVMLTGDNEKSAQAIQKKVGLDTVIAEVLPQEKERVIRDLSQKGTVAMVGDGINDAPALARADVGIAIGAGTDIAIESADIVLMHSQLSDVPAAIDLSKATVRTIKQNLFWALFYNSICIPVAAGVLSAVGITLNPMIAAAAMSLSSLFVVSNALRLRGWKPKKIQGELQKASQNETQPSLPAQAVETLQGAGETRTLRVKGMMCPKCVAHVTEALEAVDGVSSVEVSLKEEQAKVTLLEASSKALDKKLVSAVVDAGYKAKIK